MHGTSDPTSSFEFLAVGGASGALMRARDWSATPLGSAADWPVQLRTLVAVMLGSRQPMFVAWGPERTLLYNDGYAEILGRKHPGALGRGLLEVWSEIRGDLEPLVEQIDRGESVHLDDFALRIERHGALEETYFSFSYTPVRDDTGQVAGLFCPCQETTGQVLAERRNVAEREKLEQLFEQAPGFMAMLRGPEHLFDLANPAYLRLVGHRQVVGKTAAEALPEAAAQGYIALLDQVYRSGAPYSATSAKYAVQTAPGSPVDERYLDFVYQPTVDAEGRTTGIFVEGSDVTERVQAEIALRESAAFTQRLLESSGDCIKVLDLDAKLQFMSSGGMRVMEIDDFSRFHGACWPDFWHDEGHGKALEAVAQAKAGGTGRFQGFAPTAKGNVRYWDVIVSPILGEGGEPEKLLSISRDISGLHQAESALRESEADYRHAAELNPQVAWTATPDGQLDRVAERWREWTGTSGLGDSWGLGLHADDLAASVDAWTHSVTTGAPYDIEHRVKMQSGGYRWARSRAFPRRDEGRIVKWYGSTEDIHERKLSEEALRLRGEEFYALADNIPSLCWIAYADGHIFWYNRRWYDYTGTSLESQQGWGWQSVHDPELLPSIVSRWKHSIDTGEPFEMTLPLKGADGLFRPFLTRVVPIRDEADRIVRWFGTNVDISEQRQVELRLEQSVEERTRERDHLWELSEDLLAIANYEGKLLRVSPSWTRLFGYGEEALLTGLYSDIINPDDLPATMDALLTMREDGRPASFHNRVRALNGLWRWVAWTVSPEPGGERLIAVGRDITAEKEQAEALRHTEEQLRQAQKMEAVGQLTGGIAHDFNNLLTGVIGSLEMMQRRISQGRPGDIERYATAAMTSANRAAALTHRLLAFSRRQPLDPKPVNANRLVTGMEELLRRTIGEALRLEIVTAGGLWQTLCDPHQLESAILNLAINARDAMPEGGKLTIETCNAHLDNAYVAQQRDVRPGQYVCICVTDTGVGMTPDVIAKAFEPFFTTKPIGQGTGLGLSMIYGFARQSEGYAKIYSEPGQGTTVKLYLPRYYGEADGAEESLAALSPTQRAEHGEVVLVVEDETAVRDLVVDVLQDLGYRAVEAADGLTGLKLLQSDMRVDLLVTDVGLPGLNGRQLADAARAKRPHLKVLFMTGYAENATIANGFLEPRMQMITKPFAIEALATRIRDMIEGDG